jgi:hypothetical protein
MIVWLNGTFGAGKTTTAQGRSHGHPARGPACLLRYWERLNFDGISHIQHFLNCSAVI